MGGRHEYAQRPRLVAVVPAPSSLPMVDRCRHRAACLGFGRGSGFLLTLECVVKRLMLTTAAVLALSSVAHAIPPMPEDGPHIRLSNGEVWPMYTCSADYVCLDCTFLDRQTCYNQADKLGLINHNIGWDVNHGQRPAMYSKWYKKEQPLEYECKPADQHIQTSISNIRIANSDRLGEILCPVVGATYIVPKPKPAPYVLDESERVGKTPAQIEAQDWVVGFVNNVMGKRWLKQSPDAPQACFHPTCIGAYTNRYWAFKEGMEWLEAHPAPACMYKTEQMARNSWENTLDGTKVVLHTISDLPPVQFPEAVRPQTRLAGQSPDIVNDLKVSALKEIEACANWKPKEPEAPPPPPHKVGDQLSENEFWGMCPKDRVMTKMTWEKVAFIFGCEKRP
jgi:hypothetical protein